MQFLIYSNIALWLEDTFALSFPPFICDSAIKTPKTFRQNEWVTTDPFLGDIEFRHPHILSKMRYVTRSERCSARCRPTRNASLEKAAVVTVRSVCRCLEAEDRVVAGPQKAIQGIKRKWIYEYSFLFKRCLLIFLNTFEWFEKI